MPRMTRDRVQRSLAEVDAIERATARQPYRLSRGAALAAALAPRTLRHTGTETETARRTLTETEATARTLRTDSAAQLAARIVAAEAAALAAVGA